MSTENTHDFTRIAAATAILGDKWTPLIIQALSEDPSRFCHLQDEVGGVNPRTLSARLAKLESVGIITKQPCPKAPARDQYNLTKKGYDLIPIIRSMAIWGDKYTDQPV